MVRLIFIFYDRSANDTTKLCEPATRVIDSSWLTDDGQVNDNGIGRKSDTQKSVAFAFPFRSIPFVRFLCGKCALIVDDNAPPPRSI